MWETGFLKKIISTIAGKGDIKGKFLSTSDEKLIETFINENNQSAFEEIVSRYVDKIYGLALRITRNPNDTEEGFARGFPHSCKKD